MTANSLLLPSRLTVAGPGGPLIEGTLAMDRGERLALTGPSGSGKTLFTLALLGLAGRVAPGLSVQGAARWASGRRPLIGYVPQGTLEHLNPYLTVAAQLRELLATWSVPYDRTRVIHLFEQLRLRPAERVLHTFQHELSGGMRQRVLLALALLCGPELLVLDEPTSALDSVTRARVLGAVLDYCARSGAGLLVVTHHALEARVLGTRFLRIHEGAIVPAAGDDWLASMVDDGGTAVAGPHTSSVAPEARAMQPAVLEVRGLQVHRGVRRPGGSMPAFQLRDIHLVLRRGRALGLIGETGSGKTTLIAALSGLIPVRAGSLRLGDEGLLGRRGWDLRRLRRRWQAGLQDASQSLNPHFSVAEILAEPARLHGYRRPDRAAMRALLEEVALPGDCLERRADQLSFGQRQRLALARTISGFPALEVLLLDEPLTGLDADTRTLMIAFLRRAKARVALLIASHDLGVVASLCDEVLVLKDGCIVDASTPERPGFNTDYARGLWATAAIRDPQALRRALNLLDPDGPA